MKFRALGEARWILGILAAGCAVSIGFGPRPFPLSLPACSFFRSIFFVIPSASRRSDETLAVSPADGVVVEVKETGENEFIKSRVKRIGIFLSVFDVHVNRAPIAGEITHSEPMTGRFLDARNPSSSEVNARRTWAIRGKG